MEILDFKKLSDSQVFCKVEITAEELDKALEYALIDQLSKQGEVTEESKKAYLDKVGYESLYFTASQLAIEESVRYVSLEKDFKTVSMQRQVENITKVEKGSGFTAEYITDVFPPVKLGEYKGIEVHPTSTTVSAEMVDGKIQNDLFSRGKVEEKSGPAVEGDTVTIDFNGFVDGVAFEGGSAKEYDLVLGSHSFIPGFEEQLVGAKKGDSVDVKVTFPESYPAENLAGKASVFKVFVHKVSAQVLQTLTDEFVTSLGIPNVKTVDEYKAFVRAQLERQLFVENEKRIAGELFNTLVSRTKADIPKSILSALVNKKIDELTMTAEQYGLPVDTLLQYNGIPSLQAYSEQISEMTRQELVLSLALDELVKVENIKVSQEEFNKEFSYMAGIVETDSEEQKKEKTERLMRSTTPDNFAEMILHKKAIALLRENAVEIK